MMFLSFYHLPVSLVILCLHQCSILIFGHVYAAEFFPDRSEVQCLHRWQKVLNPDLVKGPWTQEVAFLLSFLYFLLTQFIMQASEFFGAFWLQEDKKITELVSKYGATKWSLIAKSLPGRIGKQCRER